MLLFVSTVLAALGCEDGCGVKPCGCVSGGVGAVSDFSVFHCIHWSLFYPPHTPPLPPLLPALTFTARCHSLPPHPKKEEALERYVMCVNKGEKGGKKYTGKKKKKRTTELGNRQFHCEHFYALPAPSDVSPELRVKEYK